MKCIYTVATNCASVTYGNIAQHVKEFVKTYFPNEFFHYETISSEIAYRNINRVTIHNSSQDLKRRRKPHLIIRPIFQVPDEMYLYNTPLTSNMDNLQLNSNMNASFPVIQDTENGIGVNYKLNRDKIDFQITVNVSTLYQQIDTYKSLLNTIYWERPFTKRLPTEHMIPRDLMRALAWSRNIDIDDENKAAGIFLDYLNRHSNSPITYKMRNGTAADEYFVYNNQLILFTFSDLQIDEGSKKNMADDSFPINFKITAEFNVPGMYLMFGDEKLRDKVMGEKLQATIVSNNSISFPLFTIENLFGDIIDPDGFRKFKSSILEMDPDKNGTDVTDFGCLLNDELLKIMRDYSKFKMDTHSIMRMHLFKDKEELVEGKDYEVDWYRSRLTTFNIDKECTYRILLYLNTIKINGLLVDETDVSQTERDHLFRN